MPLFAEAIHQSLVGRIELAEQLLEFFAENRVIFFRSAGSLRHAID
jgi:hypothetical protein